MQTDDIADTIKLTAQLMELHNENPFKVKSLQNAAFKLGKTNMNLEGLSLEELEKIDGIGKSIAHKIIELNTTGTLAELQALLTKTPQGVIEMLGIKGIGPKKVAQIWNELEIESVGELLYACYENRLVDLKGFGAKTQDGVIKYIEFFKASQGKFHYAALEKWSFTLLEEIKKLSHTQNASLTGSIRRKLEILESVDLIIASDNFDESSKEILSVASLNEIITKHNFEHNTLAIATNKGIHINIHIHEQKDYFFQLFKTTAAQKHLDKLNVDAIRDANSEEEIYSRLNLPYILPELREGTYEFDWLKHHNQNELIETSDLKGILHNHSTYSDGTHTLKEMAEYCKELGYEYLGMCDHSQSAFYANGLKLETVLKQHKEIDELNKQLSPFKIFKGIESDILNNGELDYPEEVLKTFDFIVASVHSNLKMSEEKATERLLKAIQNPYTTILGHPTGRLLLSRAGYPIDHKTIIDACAKNKVVIELNAHPYRLDLDWRWIHYCMEKNVMISINPDAHHKQGYHDMYYGVCVARKGFLTKDMCFNALSLAQIEEYFSKRKK